MYCCHSLKPEIDFFEEWNKCLTIENISGGQKEKKRKREKKERKRERNERFKTHDIHASMISLLHNGREKVKKDRKKEWEKEKKKERIEEWKGRERVQS